MQLVYFQVAYVCIPMLHECDVVLLLSNQNVFAALSLQQNTPAHDAYVLALDYAHRTLPTNINPHFLYLRAPPAICFSRILQRGRPEESEISLAYLTQLHDLHDAWLKDIPNSNFINASQHSDFVAQDVLKIIETHLLPTTLPIAAGPVPGSAEP